MNARSVRNKTSDIAAAVLSADSDLFFITETWLKSDTDETFLLRQCFYNLDEYQCVSFPRSYSTGGGIAVIFKSIFTTNILFSISELEIEMAVIETKLYKQTAIFILCYRAPSSNFAIFIDKLRDCLLDFCVNADFFCCFG